MSPVVASWDDAQEREHIHCPVKKEQEESMSMSKEHETKWYEDYAEVVAFARHLVDDDTFSGMGGEDPLEALLSYFEKPWKWTLEHASWVRAGRPSGDV